MSARIYWPKTGIKRDDGLVLGLRVEDVIVAVGIVEEWVSRIGEQGADGRWMSGLASILSCQLLALLRLHLCRLHQLDCSSLI
jgi:hypothetical protein